MKPRKTQIDNKNLIGKKILQFRHENNISQKDFMARLQILGLDISASSLSRLEWQQRAARDTELLIIAKVMHIDPNKLLDWND